MLFGYYDRNGYPNMYTGSTNGGVCPLDNSVWGASPEGYGECPLSASHQGVDSRTIKGHADDYYSRSYSTTDPYYAGSWAEHSPQDSVADFMGTSQYQNWQNLDGSTSLFLDPFGYPTNDFTGMEYTHVRDGTHGMKLFANSRGYAVITNYNQYISGYNGNSNGFTFDQYKAEIDAGHPVLIILNNHVMLGVGYNEPDQVVFHDTWDYSDHTMTWGGTYAGMTHIGVTVFHLARSSGSDFPVAGFTINPVTGPAPQSVQFTDTSTGSPTIWKWYFGDGHYSTDRNPTHTYSSAGNFSVILVATNEMNRQSDIKTSSVRVTSTEPGITWEQATAAASFPARRSHTSVAFDDRMWVIGGVTSAEANDIWYSHDGGSWTQATPNAGFAGRESHDSVVFNNKMWVIGGDSQADGTFKTMNDVWYSGDGANWIQATGSAQFSGRNGHRSGVFDNKIWVIGGTSYNNGQFTFLNDVWYSDDGTNWTRATPAAAFPARNNFGFVIFNNKMWVIGGYNYNGMMNDVWYSSDGVTWTRATASAGFSPRTNYQALIFSDKIWVIGGYSGTYKNDVWYSSDGITWTQAMSSADFSIRDKYASVVYKDRIWIIGGFVGGNNYRVYNDVWYSPPPVPLADFAAEPLAGTAPLTVRFTDLSSDVIRWNWSFGDGTWFNTTVASMKNPTHKYSNAGTFPVSLIVSNSWGSNTTTRAGYITVTPTSPTPAFTGSPLSGPAPLTVTFTDLSTGSPTSRNWSLGDGTFSTAQNPVHIYANPGAFTVSLTSANSAGSNTRTEARYITVAARSQNAGMTLNGTTITTSGGKQSVTVNLTNVNGTVTQPDLHSVIVQNPGSGWSQMELVSPVPVTSEAGNLNISEISQVVLTTTPLVAALNQSTLGTVTAQISIPMNQVPTGVTIEQNIFEGAHASASTAFQLAATNDNLDINNVAYTIEIKNTAALNANLTGASDPVKLNLSISHGWVVANGGTGSIRIIRSAEDGTKQVLTTRFLFNDAVMNMDFFEADSPGGLSVFGVASVSGSSQSAGSSVISSDNGNSDSGSSASYTSPLKSTEMRAPPDTSAGPWTTHHMSGQTHISQIDIQTIGSVPDLLVLSETMDSLPQGIVHPDIPVDEYHKIDLYHATNDEINQAVIEFTVSETWLNEQKMTIHDVQLLRYHEKEWEKLPTEYVGKKNGNLIFRATTEGFSYFATALVKGATIVADPKPTTGSITAIPSPAISSPATPAPGIKTASIKNPVTPALQKTMAAPPMEEAPKNEGAPVPVFIIGIAGVIITSLSIFLVRRWWIRRQNPSLFRDYD